jgi:hypothetical protein
LALKDPNAPDGERLFSRLALFPIRPIDLAKALAAKREDEEGEDDDGKGGCVTVGACVAKYSAAFAAFLATQPDPGAIRAAVDAASDQCWETVQPSLGVDLGKCE